MRLVTLGLRKGKQSKVQVLEQWCFFNEIHCFYLFLSIVSYFSVTLFLLIYFLLVSGPNERLSRMTQSKLSLKTDKPDKVKEIALFRIHILQIYIMDFI